MSTHEFDSLPMEGSNAFDKNDKAHDSASIVKASAEEAFRSEYLMSSDLKVLPKNEIKVAENDLQCKSNQTKDANGNCKDQGTSHGGGGGGSTHGWFYNWYYGSNNSSSNNSAPAEKTATPTNAKPTAAPESASTKTSAETTHGRLYNWYYGIKTPSSNISAAPEKMGMPSEPGGSSAKTLERPATVGSSSMSKPSISEPIIPRTSVPSFSAGESVHGSFGGFGGEAGGFGG